MREPDKTGIARAWKIEQTPELIAAHIESWGSPPAGVGPSWIVNGPYHPFWAWWHVACISLADIEGIPPAHRQYPEAEFEIMCLSLNPDPKGEGCYPPDIAALEAGDTKHGLPGYLTPPDWIVHFHGVTADQAAAICELAVDHIVAGQSCDSDFREHWKLAITKTVEHYLLGVHS